MSDDKTKIFSAMRARTQENIARQEAAEYTPTTATLREAYWRSQSRSVAQADAQFDRWLTDHDRQVAAKAVEDAADWLDRDPASALWEMWNAERAEYSTPTDALRKRAAAIVSEPETPEQEN